MIIAPATVTTGQGSIKDVSAQGSESREVRARKKTFDPVMGVERRTTPTLVTTEVQVWRSNERWMIWRRWESPVAARRSPKFATVLSKRGRGGTVRVQSS